MKTSILAALTFLLTLTSCTGQQTAQDPATGRPAAQGDGEQPIHSLCRTDSKALVTAEAPPPQDPMHRVSPEQKHLPKGSPVPSNLPDVDAHVIAAQHRFLAEAEKLRAKAGQDPEAYEHARAALKEQMLARP